MTLAEFLLARIAEDEAIARRSVNWSEGITEWADGGDPDWEHIARWDPARVLAECEAKREIVVEMAYDGLGPREWILHQLALPYAGHPDYRQEWA